jgi:hypothetical protein
VGGEESYPPLLRSVCPKKGQCHNFSRDNNIVNHPSLPFVSSDSFRSRKLASANTHVVVQLISLDRLRPRVDVRTKQNYDIRIPEFPIHIFASTFFFKNGQSCIKRERVQQNRNGARRLRQPHQHDDPANNTMITYQTIPTLQLRSYSVNRILSGLRQILIYI